MSHVRQPLCQTLRVRGSRRGGRGVTGRETEPLDKVVIVVQLAGKVAAQGVDAVAAAGHRQSLVGHHVGEKKALVSC